MGHYDSCRDAEDRVEMEEYGTKICRILDVKTDEEIGNFFRAIKDLQNLSRAMIGILPQHEKAAELNKKIDEFLKE